MPLTVRELKERCKLEDADVVGLKDGVTYVVRLKGVVPLSRLEHLRGLLLSSTGINALVCDESVEFLEIVE